MTITKKLPNRNTFNKSQEIYPMRCTLMEKGYEKPMYIYGSQYLNYYSQQKKELRERIQKDKNNFYTYSKEFLSLSIDPYDVEEEKLKKIWDEKATLKNQNRDEFRSIPKK